MYMKARDALEPIHLAIVDHDMTILRSLCRTLSGSGYTVTAFQSPAAFVESLGHGPPDAVLVDVRSPDTDGRALLDQLHQEGYHLPVVFLTGRDDTPPSAARIRAEVVDVIANPGDERALLASLARAVEVARSIRALAPTRDELRAKWSTLTPREQQVCAQMVQGRPNRQIAADLGTCEKTIKVHRTRVMAKMGVRSLSDLVRYVDCLNTAPTAADRRSPPADVPRQTEPQRVDQLGMRAV